MKKFFRNIHLILGLAAGLVITTSCITGSILVFEDEIEESLHSYRYYVEPEGERIPLEQITVNVKKELGNVKINYHKVYNDPRKTVIVGYVIPPKEKKAEGKDKGKKKKENVIKAFVNPYTGDVIDILNYRETFFYQVFSLHRWLLSGDTGKLITGISTSIFLFIIITGIVLWWPKTKNILRQRLKVKWSAQPKRLIHDLHTVLGFYACLFLFVTAFTGLAWSFEWFDKAIYTITGTTKELPKAPLSTDAQDANNGGLLTAVYQNIFEMVPDAVSYQLNQTKDDSSTMSVAVSPMNPAHSKASDLYYFDQYTGLYKGELLFSDRNIGQKTRSYFYPIHTGSIGGTSTKILSLVVCLIGAMLPVTGYIMWWNRTKKKRKNHISI